MQMVVELADAYQTSLAQEDRIRHLKAQLRKSEENCTRTKQVCQETFKANQEFMDRCLAAQLEAEERAVLVEEKAKSYKDLLDLSQEPML